MSWHRSFTRCGYENSDGGFISDLELRNHPEFNMGNTFTSSINANATATVTYFNFGNNKQYYFDGVDLIPTDRMGDHPRKGAGPNELWLDKRIEEIRVAL